MRVFFFAKVGNLNKKPYGGGEVGNRRTIKLLKDLGYTVFLIPRYYTYKKKSILIYLIMILGDFFSLLKLAIKLSYNKRHNSVVHIAGFTGQYLPYEFLSVLTAKVLGYKVIYEIRGGGIIGFFNNGNFIYKYLFKATIRIADTIFSQGLENKELITGNSKSEFFYYPNYIENSFMPKTCPIKDTKSINLVYIGRLCPSKNIDIILKAFNIIKQHIDNTSMHIIGDSEDYPKYVISLKKYVREMNLENSCHFYGKLDRTKITQLLPSMHFFLFPTTEKREGQSNSLTETMSYGIIPISSSQGYSRRIINNDFLIEDTLTAEAYAKKIINIIESNQINCLSSSMYNRIKDNYLYDIIKLKVEKEYKKLFY